jgi:hypothetical protein
MPAAQRNGGTESSDAACSMIKEPDIRPAGSIRELGNEAVDAGIGSVYRRLAGHGGKP